MTNIGVHVRHCCVLHGCKYTWDRDCPVARWEVVQEHPCERCEPDEGRLVLRVEVSHSLSGQWRTWGGPYDSVVGAMLVARSLIQPVDPDDRPIAASRIRLAARVVTPWAHYSPPESVGG